MKKATYIIGILLIGILVFGSSCDDNSKYSLGKFSVNLATVQPEGDNAYALLLDNGKRLWPAATDVLYSPKYNQRVIVNYTVLSDTQNGYDHYIKVNDIWNVLTKQAIELSAHNADSIGNDPVRTNAVWVGGDYLNVSFMFNYGGVKPHAINLVTNALKESPSADPETIELEFRHNAYGSASTRLFEGFVCFDLKPLRVADADSVKLTIKVKEWADEKIYNVVYKYNAAITPDAVAEMPIPVITSNEYY